MNSKWDKSLLRQSIIQHLEDDDDLPENDDNLIDYGLDSVAVMTLIGEWKKRGIELSFAELARLPTIDAWWGLMSNPRQGGNEY